MNDLVVPDADAVTDALRDVIDPELGYNIVDLGLIYALAIEDGVVTLSMTMTTPGCPAQDYLIAGVEDRIRQLPGVTDLKVDVVWEPPWSPQRMSPLARAQFGIAD
ncbi:MAG: metal-sulfur cluster assembly factor [Gammaproteobacteria bacterium]|nr:metal-sulfur cluster assembly factor [Gammaproteobacteria bacterium]